MKLKTPIPIVLRKTTESNPPPGDGPTTGEQEPILEVNTAFASRVQRAPESHGALFFSALGYLSLDVLEENL